MRLAFILGRGHLGLISDHEAVRTADGKPKFTSHQLSGRPRHMVACTFFFFFLFLIAIVNCLIIVVLLGQFPLGNSGWIHPGKVCCYRVAAIQLKCVHSSPNSDKDHNLVNYWLGVLSPDNPLRITSGLMETLIKRQIVERTNKPGIRPAKLGQKADSCRENLWNEIQLKGP